MLLWQSVLLGIVQGLGEFLPISSSAHLVIIPWLFNFEDPGLTFDVALHFGTLIAILAYFWKDWLLLFKAAFNSFNKKNRPATHEEKLFWYLVIASVPGAAVGYMLEKYAEEAFRSPLLIAGSMTVMGFLLWWVDTVSKKNKSIEQIGLKESFLIGLSQAFAIIPGVSRSGVTITTGLGLGLSRVAAARFSFLLSTPIIAGAALLKAKTFIHSGLTKESLIGIGVSALFGLLSIKYMLAYVQKYSYRVFVIYRFVFSIMILVVYFLFKSH